MNSARSGKTRIDNMATTENCRGSILSEIFVAVSDIKNGSILSADSRLSVLLPYMVDILAS